MFRGENDELTLVGILCSIILGAPIAVVVGEVAAPIMGMGLSLFVMFLAWTGVTVALNCPVQMYEKLLFPRHCRRLKEKSETIGKIEAAAHKYEARTFCEELREVAQLVDRLSGKDETDTNVNQTMGATAKTLSGIADAVEQRPELVSRCRRCKNYYLPQIRKMLDEYEYLADKQESKNASDACKSIVQSFSLINAQLFDMYDHFFASNALDASTDVVVLENLSGRI